MWNRFNGPAVLFELKIGQKYNYGNFKGSVLGQRHKTIQISTVQELIVTICAGHRKETEFKEKY